MFMLGPIGFTAPLLLLGDSLSVRGVFGRYAGRRGQSHDLRANPLCLLLDNPPRFKPRSLRQQVQLFLQPAGVH